MIQKRHDVSVSTLPHRTFRRFAPLLLALATASSPVLAEGWFGFSNRDAFEGGPGAVRVPVRTDRTIRRASPGTRNIVALMGASTDGSAEESYSRNLHQRVGGDYLHGRYGIGDLVDTMVPRTGRRVPISNLYFAGHMTGTPRANFPELTPARPGEPNLGFLLAGRQDMGHALNYRNQFFEQYDARMGELGLTPDQVWAPNAQIVLKNCKAAYYDRPFLEEFSRRVPKGATIEAYDKDFNWSSYTQYPLGIQTGLTHNLGRQRDGLVILPGQWEPPARTAQLPVADSAGVEPAVTPEPAASSTGDASVGLGRSDRSVVE